MTLRATRRSALTASGIATALAVAVSAADAQGPGTPRPSPSPAATATAADTAWHGAPPPAPGSRADTARMLFVASRFADARAILAADAERTRDPAALFVLGRLAFVAKDYDAAAAFLERSSAVDSTRAATWEWLGNAYANQAFAANVIRRLVLAPRAKASWERAVALDPSDVAAHEHLVEYALAVPVAMGGGPDAADAHVAAIVRADPWRGRHLALSLANRRGHATAVERELRQLTAAFPDSAGPFADLVTFLLGRRRHDEAFAAVDARLARSASEPVALYQLGRVAATAGRRGADGARALERFLTARAADPRFTAGGAYYWLGRLREADGRPADARELYRRSLAVRPGDTTTQSALARVESSLAR